MLNAEDRLDAALRIIEDYPKLHVGPTGPFVFSALERLIGAAPENAEAGRNKLRPLDDLAC